MFSVNSAISKYTLKLSKTFGVDLINSRQSDAIKIGSVQDVDFGQNK